MTPEKATELFLERAQEIEMAIIGESVRWGDTYSTPPRNKDDDWQPAVDDIINNYFPDRTAIVLNQLKDAALYPDINPPVFYNNDTELTDNIIEITPEYKIKLINNNGSGNIYYTTDGSDPRAIGGDLSSSAQDGGNEIEVTANSTMKIRARILDGTAWSAVHENILYIPGDFSNLVVTEINYHPLDNDTISHTEYEFLELKNIGTESINISEAYFEDGITFTFPAGTIVNPGEFILLSSNMEEFNNRYGFYPFGQYSGQLDNGGESLTLLTAAADTIFSVVYDDKSPWPEAADGGGYSLVNVNPSGNLNDPANWENSYNIHGSPGQDDLSTSVENNDISMPENFSMFQNYPNPFNPETTIHYNITKTGKIKLTVYDILGKEISTLVNKIQTPGSYKLRFSGEDLSSNIYFYRLETTEGIITKKMILLK